MLGVSDDADRPVPTRAHRRVRGEWTVRLAEDPRELVATDLCVGGLFVAGLTAREPGDPIPLQVDLDGGTLSVRSVVRWVRPGGSAPGSGLEFEALSDDDRARIALALRPPETP